MAFHRYQWQIWEIHTRHAEVVALAGLDVLPVSEGHAEVARVRAAPAASAEGGAGVVVGAGKPGPPPDRGVR